METRFIFPNISVIFKFLDFKMQIELLPLLFTCLLSTFIIVGKKNFIFQYLMRLTL